jgi:hypothetical protein
VSIDLLRPRDHAEKIALFRAEIIGALIRREPSRGELGPGPRAMGWLLALASTTSCMP